MSKAKSITANLLSEAQTRNKKPSVDVLIIHFGSISDTKACLQSVLKNSYSNFKIILINNSKDHISSLVTKKIKLIDHRQNYGFARSNNIAIEQSKAKYCLLLNNDVIVHKDFIKHLVEIAVVKNASAVQAKIRSFYHRAFFDPSAAGGFIDKLGYPYTRGRIGIHIEKDLGQYDDVCQIFWASGCASLYQRKDIIRAGLLPENFFAYHEETDLCWRLNNLNYKIYFAPKALCYHKAEASWRSFRTQKIFLIHKNNLLLICRNMSLKKLIWVLPIRFILDALTILIYFRQKKLNYIYALLKAYPVFVLNLPMLFVYRLQTRNINRGADTWLKPFSIYLLYYLFGIKRYSDIANKKSTTPLKLYKQIIDD